ncbi:Zinc finger CCCH domain-containing protein 19 [Camellia lanceoleosa]|uniref:Zinc finger CCCH domain-containing protein 19 n=1 Tax=Camellia lanceoleosa TaxID=1840588 RepID=A0ACC0IJB1_9ERIC|nr:Zinc finger CCCH domain-containing protein 19 [Camellia lanceoleosa]
MVVGEEPPAVLTKELEAEAERVLICLDDRVDFDDKSSWEYLFKDCWINLKQKLSLSSVELAQAKNPWKGSDLLSGKHESPEEVFDANNDQGSGSDSSKNLEVVRRKRRQSKKRSKPLTKEDDLPSSTAAIGAEETAIPGNTEWASQDLLEFVMHVKDGDRSVSLQYDVQALLLEYIKRNKLRDPRRKSQIVCDARLINIFGKTRVAHFEMLKLIESHFLIKEDSQIDDIQGTVVDTEVNRLEADGAIDAPTKGSKDRKRKMRKKGDGRGPQSNLDDYAAIDMHNINLIYLRRKLVEDLLEDMERFPDKVDGTFVRIRISGSNQKQDIYRLVQVVGTRKAAEPYKVGKKTMDLVLEILNLNKTEVVSIDTISNQEFTEDECKRLRQSIKCGLINRLTVGGILDKAMEVQAARVNDERKGANLAPWREFLFNRFLEWYKEKLCSNAVWVPMQGNPNMGWAGPPPPPPPQQPVATNMNWVPAVQGPVPGTVNPGWVASPGNPGAMVQGLPPGNPNPGWAAEPSNVNPGWAAQAGNPGSGNGNAGWVPSTGNPGNVQGPALGNVNPVWAGPTGNPGTTVQGPAPPGNANLGWGAPPGNSINQIVVD